MRFLFLFFLLGINCAVWAYDLLFPVAKNGKWGLVTQQGEIVLNPVYDYIEYNVKGKKFIYYQGGKMGLIHVNGTILSKPVYENISFLDTSWVAYADNGKWGLYKNEQQVLKAEFDSVSWRNKQVFDLVSGDSLQLFLNENQLRSTHWYTHVSKKDDFFICLRSNGLYDLLKDDDLSMLVPNMTGCEANLDKFFICRFADGYQLFSKTALKFISEKYDYITHVFDSYFILKKGNYSFLFDAAKNKNYPIPELDEISRIVYPYLYFISNEQTGIWHLEKEKIITEALYDGISLNDGVFYTRLNNLYGIVTTDAREILSPSFTSIVAYDNLYLVEQNGLFGLVSKNGKEIKPCQYNEIRVYDQNVKCFSGKKLDLLNLDANGNVNAETSYSNYMSISFDQEKEPRQRSREINFSGTSLENQRKEYESLGWFQKTSERIIRDTVRIIKGNWGLKYNEDSVAIQPRFPDILVRTPTQYTECYLQKVPVQRSKESLKSIREAGAIFRMTNNSWGTSRGFFRLADHLNKKLLSKVLFQSVRYTDFKQYKLARALTKMPVLINALGEVIYDSLTYYGDYTENILPVCVGGTYVTGKYSNKQCPEQTYSFLSALGLEDYDVGAKETYFSIQGGKWYFINAAGQQINQQPFDFVKPFNRNRSIVLRNGKWGVIDSTLKEIVPIKYQSVEELFIGGEQFFKVADPVSNTYTYKRSMGQLDKTDIKKTQYYCEGRWFAQNKAGVFALVDTMLQPLTDFKFQFVSPFEDGFAMVTERGKKSIIDLNGKEYLQGYKAKDINYIGFGRFEIIQTKGLLIVSADTDTLLVPKQCKKVLASNANYVIYMDPTEKLQLYSNSAVDLPKSTKITSYDLDHETLLLEKKGVSRIYSLQSKKYISKPITGVVKLGPNGYVFKNADNKIGLVNLAGDTLIDPLYMDIEFQPNNWAVARVDKRTLIRINLQGDALDDQEFTRYIRKKDHYIFYKPGGIGVFDTLGKMVLPCIYDDIELYNSNFYKTTLNEVHDLFYLSGQKVIPGNYADYKGYSAGTMIVKYGSLDYLYSGFLNKSLSFQSVTPVNSDLFILYEYTHQGMYNAAGEITVPIRYHNIVIDRQFIQVRFFNSFGYYSKEGTPLFDPI